MKQLRSKKGIWLGLLITAIMSMTACGNDGQTQEEPTEIVAQSTTAREEMQSIEKDTEPDEQLTSLSVHFLDVGQGDAIFLTCGEDAMLIDAGDNDHGTAVQNYLQKQGIDKLKYVIATHPDADHIGGMDVILYKFDCETVIMTDIEKDTATYRDVIDVMADKGYQNTLPVVGDMYTFGDAAFTIVGPAKISEDSNNNSVAILLTHGENKFLFTGDAQEEEEADIVNTNISLEADVYKAGHHGSKTSSSRQLLEAVSPTYAVISCAEGNSYGYPHAQTLNSLRSMGVSVFRTDEQGTVIVTSDGTALAWNCSPSQTWKAGEATQSANETQQAGEATQSANETQQTETASNPPAEQSNTITYICNMNTGKFHYPSCSSVDQMSEKNKLPVTWSREEVMNQGYVPCKRCNP